MGKTEGTETYLIIKELAWCVPNTMFCGLWQSMDSEPIVISPNAAAERWSHCEILPVTIEHCTAARH